MFLFILSCRFHFKIKTIPVNSKPTQKTLSISIIRTVANEIVNEKESESDDSIALSKKRITFARKVDSS